jgi:hypothetical protein
LTSVLGFPLDDAVAALAKEGFSVDTVEVRSRKGVAGGSEARVVRQRMNGRNATLYYSIFKTQPNEANA